MKKNKEWFEYGSYKFIEYDKDDPNTKRKLQAVGHYLNNSLSSLAYQETFQQEGSIVIIQCDNKIVGHTYIKDGKMKFISGHKNECIVEKKILKACYKFNKNLKNNNQNFENACLRYAQKEQRENIKHLMSTIIDDKKRKNINKIR